MKDMQDATEKIDSITKELDEKKDECEEVRIAGEERVLEYKNQVSQLKDSTKAE